MVGCVFSQLNPRSSTFLAVERSRPSASAFSTAKNVELRGFYPIPKFKYTSTVTFVTSPEYNAISPAGLVQHRWSYSRYSLWAVFHKGLKIESRRTHIIRFIGTKTKINILAKNLEGVPLLKLSKKGKPGYVPPLPKILFRIISYQYYRYLHIWGVFPQVLMVK